MGSAERASLAVKRVQARGDLCRDCHACMLACSLYHEGACAVSLARLLVNKDMAKYAFDIHICQHCDDPACEPACPTGALCADERGVLVIVDDECTRCGSCAQACSYGAIFYSAERDKYLKCDLCAGWAEGPLCVAVCPVGALTLES